MISDRAFRCGITTYDFRRETRVIISLDHSDYLYRPFYSYTMQSSFSKTLIKFKPYRHISYVLFITCLLVIVYHMPVKQMKNQISCFNFQPPEVMKQFHDGQNYFQYKMQYILIKIRIHLRVSFTETIDLNFEHIVGIGQP